VVPLVPAGTWYSRAKAQKTAWQPKQPFFAAGLHGWLHDNEEECCM